MGSWTELIIVATYRWWMVTYIFECGV